MSDFLSVIEESVLNNAISLSVFQEMLIDITDDTLKDIQETIESHFFISKKSSLSTLIHFIFISAEYRVLKVPLYCTLIKNVIIAHKDSEDEIKKKLLNSFIQPAAIHGSRCFFLRSCMNNGIISQQDVVDSCRRLYLMRPSNPERLMTSFCWFCPELEKLDKSLFDIVLSAILKNREMGMIHPTINNFLNIYTPLSQNDWQVYRACLQYGFNPDRLVIMISNDAVEHLEAFSKSENFDPNYVVPNCIFDCSQILDSKQTLLQTAAFFGAKKCFSFLLKVGANPELCSDKSKTLLSFAVAGGHHDMIENVLSLDSDLTGALETAVKFHQNEIFDYLLENKVKKTENLIEIYRSIINECAASNNLYLLLKCIENGVDVNYTDCIDVF
ncbi:hypothetical protein TRFO_20834 [Tritrichomonas foetus]|uniref:Uncharacterized protein n=1 Tax=Tritrichomonas foetus TaxID=1144522 RepID=A0A1J4KF19_9EUKA|nr:hypothetical protein TRFO_20834 [Tritrichomonas foetus]|eukprot:OHT10031.1 hypothetical protein TRFO_20834 [Tritrichomonas foetus]